MLVYSATGLGVKQGKCPPRDVNQITHLVLHITGVGIYKLEKKFPTKTPLQLAEHKYTVDMLDSPHEVVGHEGVCLVCPKELWARHVGGPKMLAMFPTPAWHKEFVTSHPGAKECIDSAWRAKLWGVGSANRVSYGIELVMPRSAVSGMFTQAQLDNLMERINSILTEIPSIKYITTHSLLAPARRSTATHPYDLPPRLSNQILVRLNGLLATFPRLVEVYLGPIE